MALDISTARADVAKIYIAAFDRVPDSAGLDFWVNSYMAGTDTLSTIAQKFTASTEYVAAYPSYLTNTEYVARIYTNVFNRAADTDGQTFWVNHLVAGTLTRGTLMKAMVDAAAANSSTDGAMLANQAEYGVYTAVQQVPFATANAQLSTITSDAATLTAAKTAVAGSAGGTIGGTFALTSSIDTYAGTANNDTISAVIDSVTAANTTFTALDSINGGAGTDTINFLAPAALDTTGTAGVSISNVEVANFRAGTTVTTNTTTWTGLTNLNVTQATAVTATAATTTDVSVSGATGAIGINGGKAVTVTDATAAQNITIGATTVNAGAITVTDTNQTSGVIAVDGGTNVSITSTGANTGAITVGQGGAATDLPSGTVTVVNNYTNAAAAATNLTGGNITVTGGSTISVTTTATQGVMTTASTNSTIDQGDVTIVAGTNTTSVSVKQAADVAAVNTVLAVAGNAEAQTVTFGAMANGETLTINGLTFTAAKALTAAQVAAAFSNLVASDTQGSASTTNGVFTNTSTTLAMTSGAVTTVDGVSTVVFTSTTNANLAALTIGGTATGTSVTKTVDGAATVAATGKGGVTTGVVLIDDNTTAASITTISVDGYATASRIGTTTDTTVLSSLTLKNAAADVTMTVDDTAATLALAVENMGTSTDTDEAVVTFTAAPTTLNVTATGNNYIDLTAAATTTLSVAGTGLLNIADVDLAGLTTVTVTGSASLVLSGSENNTLTSVTTTGTTGAVTATIEGARATYTGGAGVDTVTLVTDTALTKAIDLGAGDDTLVFSAAVASSTATLSAGDGTDTLSMTVAMADALDATTQTFYTNFERLLLNTAAGDDDNSADTVTIDLEKLGFTSYVTSNGTVVDTTTPASSDVLALSNMASGGTLKIVASAAGADTEHTVAVKNAATGTADSLNVVLSSAGALNFGSITAANVETINVTATDTDTTAHSDTLVLTAAAATAVTVAGNASLTLTMTGSTAVTSINASSMTGGLTVTSLNTTAATTITGGAGADVLTAATGTTADVLIGGAGNDTLTANAGLSTLTGGTGADTFVITAASLNSSSYATITDFAAGDSIKFTGADSFRAAAITQADTAVFQDYVNAAMNAIGADDLAWFQYLGNTYIVMDEGTTNSTSFINGEDKIVKLTGLVDLSTASFNDTSDTIQIG